MSKAFHYCKRIFHRDKDQHFISETVPQGHVSIRSVLGVSAESHLIEVGLCFFLANASSFFGQACLDRCMHVSCSIMRHSLQLFGQQSAGSSVHGIFQARILEWVAIPSPGDLPDPGIKPKTADSLSSEPLEKPIQVCKDFFLVDDIGHKIFVCEVVQNEQGERASET